MLVHHLRSQIDLDCRSPPTSVVTASIVGLTAVPSMIVALAHDLPATWLDRFGSFSSAIVALTHDRHDTWFVHARFHDRSFIQRSFLRHGSTAFAHSLLRSWPKPTIAAAHGSLVLPSTIVALTYDRSCHVARPHWLIPFYNRGLNPRSSRHVVRSCSLPRS